jgi:hypothetical protein
MVMDKPLELDVVELVRAYVFVAPVAVFCNVNKAGVKVLIFIGSLKVSVAWCIFMLRVQLEIVGAVVSAVYVVTFFAAEVLVAVISLLFASVKAVEVTLM